MSKSLYPVTLTFLGTGSMTNSSRSQSCIGMTIKTRNKKPECWLFDCGDAALRQAFNYKDLFRGSQVSKIFITHLHLDHCSGLSTFISFLLVAHSHDKNYKLDIYGPHHLSAMLKNIFYYSGFNISLPVIVHEFLTSDQTLDDLSALNVPNFSVEAIKPDADSYWTCFKTDDAIVRSGSLQHMVPCWGYCYQQLIPSRTEKDDKGHMIVVERTNGKKIAIFGDTCNSEHMTNLIQNCDLLVHELTYGPILTDLNRKHLSGDLTNWKSIQQEELKLEKNQLRWTKVKQAALKWKHSNAEMVGKYATRVQPQKLILTHIGDVYGCPKELEASMRYLLEEQVKEWFDGDVTVSYDGFSYQLD